MKASTLLCPAFVGLAYGMAWPGPAPTAADAAGDQAFQGFTPKPTEAPGERFGAMELFKRADPLGSMCGYASGIKASSWYCYNDKTCSFITKQGSFGTVACCTGSNVGDCTWNNACIDSKRYAALGCGSTCTIDPDTIRCTGAGSPFCQSSKWVKEGVTAFDCGVDSASTWVTMQTNYIGQQVSSASSSTDHDDDHDSDHASSSKTDSSTTSSSSTSAATSSSSSKSSTPVGAIVGGVIGGLALIALIVGAGIFFLLKSKRSRQQAGPNGPTSYGGGVPPAGSAPQAHTYYPPPNEKTHMGYDNPQGSNTGLAPPGQHQYAPMSPGPSEMSAEESSAPAYSQHSYTPNHKDAPPIPELH